MERKKADLMTLLLSQLQFCHNNKKAQRYLLHGFECVVAVHQSQLISKIPHILKEMYDADLLEEDIILGWAEKVRGSISHATLARYLNVVYCMFSPC